MYIKQNGEIWQVLKKEVTVYGTHSHSKTKIFIKPFQGGGERTVNLAHHDKVDVLEIKRKEGQCISKGPTSVQIMDMVSYETFEAEPLSPGSMDEVSEGDTVTFINVDGKVFLVGKR